MFSGLFNINIQQIVEVLRIHIYHADLAFELGWLTLSEFSWTLSTVP